MELHEQLQGAVTVIKPEGPLVAAGAEQFKSKILQVLISSLGRCVVDASAIPFVDSKGLEAMVEVNEEMAKSGQSLRLCGANETVRQVLELTELSSAFEHFEDANAAVRSFL